MNRYPIKCIIISALLIFAALVAPVYCQDDSNIMTMDGSVVSVDPSSSRIVVKTTETFTFSVPSDAKLIDADGFDIKLSDIDSGDYVTVGYYNDKSGAHIVRSIEVEYKS